MTTMNEDYRRRSLYDSSSSKKARAKPGKPGPVERLGAKLDGILRSHQIADNGTLRDTCVYSIIACEWPTVKAHLTWQLQRPRQPGITPA